MRVLKQNILRIAPHRKVRFFMKRNPTNTICLSLISPKERNAPIPLFLMILNIKGATDHYRQLNNQSKWKQEYLHSIALTFFVVLNSLPQNEAATLKRGHHVVCPDGNITTTTSLAAIAIWNNRRQSWCEFNTWTQLMH